MSSTNKTSNLRLNNWNGTDKPERIDFNRDNDIIDSAITEHKNDTDIHINANEREKWNSFTQMGVYFGNGSEERVITFDTEYDIALVLIFAHNRPSAVTHFSSQKKSNYVGFASKLSNSLGVKLNDDFRSVTVNQDNTPFTQGEYAALNESGVAYNYIMFR